MKSQSTSSTEFLTAREAAALLRVEPWTIYEMAKTKPNRPASLPAFRLGNSRTLRFRRDDVLSQLQPVGGSSASE